MRLGKPDSLFCFRPCPRVAAADPGESEDVLSRRGLAECERSTDVTQFNARGDINTKCLNYLSRTESEQGAPGLGLQVERVPPPQIRRPHYILHLFPGVTEQEGEIKVM